MLLRYFYLLQHELLLVTCIIALLLYKVIAKPIAAKQMLYGIHAMLLVVTVASFFIKSDGRLPGEMLVTNQLILTEKSILLSATLLISAITWDWIIKHEHICEFYILLLTSLVGMFAMLSSNHWLLLYVGLEMASIPLAALVCFDLQRRTASEAAMKLIVSSAFASGLLLMGISFLYGLSGNLHFIAADILATHKSLYLLAFSLIISGFVFKLSAVPFHLWTADVYEGAPSGVTAFLSVVSKAAITGILMQVLYVVFKPIATVWVQLLMVIGLITVIVGNVFAVTQTHIKRLMAYSSIAQMGFIILALSGCSTNTVASIVYFLVVYAASNIAIFGVIHQMEKHTDYLRLSSFAGLYKKNPVLAYSLALGLFSLAGIPPAAGFFGKFFLLFSAASHLSTVLLLVAALNMVVSLYYYLNMVRIIFSAAPNNSSDLIPVQLSISLLPKISLLICTGIIVFAGLFSGIYEYLYQIGFSF